MLEIKEKCACGYTADNKMIQPKCTYSGIGWVLYFIGISAQPVKVELQCQKCGEVLRSTEDPKELKKYVGR